jgi:hypothetical protein
MRREVGSERWKRKSDKWKKNLGWVALTNEKTLSIRKGSALVYFRLCTVPAAQEKGKKKSVSISYAGVQKSVVALILYFR